MFQFDEEWRLNERKYSLGINDDIAGEMFDADILSFLLLEEVSYFAMILIAKSYLDKIHHTVLVRYLSRAIMFYILGKCDIWDINYR
jgi:hypothetical protein